MSPAKDKNKNLEKLSFEQCLEQLDELVREMESGNIPLEEMIAKFEEGTALAALCHEKLNSLKQKIEMLRNPRTLPEEKDPPQNSSSLFGDTPF